MKLTTWHIQSGNYSSIVRGVVTPDNFDQNDELYVNRMKRTLYNCKNREFPAAHEKIKVLKVEIERDIQGL